MLRTLRRVVWGCVVASPLLSAVAAASSGASLDASSSSGARPDASLQTAPSGQAVAPAPSPSTVGAIAPAASEPTPPQALVAPSPAPLAAPAAATPVAPPAAKKPPADEGPPLFRGTGRFTDPFYEVGGTVVSGGLMYGGSTKTPTLTGVRVFEHHGYLARGFMGLLVALGQSNSRYVGSTYSTDGQYVYRTDYYRSLTASERASQERELSDAVNGKYSAEFTYYAPNLFNLDGSNSNSRGFETSIGGELALGSGGGGLPALLTIGGYAAYIQGSPELRTQPTATVQHTHITYSNVGLMLRLHYPINKIVDVSAEWDANILSLFGGSENARRTSPLKVGAYVNLTDRVYLRGQGILGGFGVSGGKLGMQAEAGIRF